MKKILLILLAVLTLFSFTACANPYGYPIVDDIEIEQGLTAEEICTNKVLEDYVGITVLGTICNYWYLTENEEEVYLVQVDSSVDGQGSSALYYVGIKYIRNGEKISEDELIDCYVLSKVG